MQVENVLRYMLVLGLLIAVLVGFGIGVAVAGEDVICIELSPGVTWCS